MKRTSSFITCVSVVVVVEFSCALNLEYPLDDPEVSKGLPVGIQLVGPSLQEEIVLGLGEVVDAALKAYAV